MEIKKTITSIFMVPTLQIGRDILKENGFINAFIKDGEKDAQYENAVYLLFQPKNFDKFERFLDKERARTTSLIDDYDYDNGYVVLVYKLDTKFNRDFDLIRAGKYSKTSKAFRSFFSDKIPIKIDGKIEEEYSLQYRVFNRTKDMIEYWEEKFGVKFEDSYEVWEGFDEANETLNLSKIKENVQ